MANTTMAKWLSSASRLDNQTRCVHVHMLQVTVPIRSPEVVTVFNIKSDETTNHNQALREWEDFLTEDAFKIELSANWLRSEVAELE